MMGLRLTSLCPPGVPEIGPNDLRRQIKSASAVATKQRMVSFSFMGSEHFSQGTDLEQNKAVGRNKALETFVLKSSCLRLIVQACVASRIRI